MNTIKAIRRLAEINKWPYPRFFEMLKAEGVHSYTVRLEDQYHAIFEGSFGKWEELEFENYYPLKTSEQFSSEAVKEAIINHMKRKTNYIEFLENIAKAGVSHYHVNMAKRQIRYFNPNETLYHQEMVPYLEENEAGYD